ncbi:uncharacterized protein DUF4174 [Hasllibacter halocynthiae]|uniref:Uncharacterized protein DUF4174 n=1 Tax=Hasllibacter halocynthiae TaxID=595589 RepID=A0A2T0X6K0_9RHOB|nr:DUF4174 domain-containing protein [Hasllibacter halocynthiae]PRY94581.1 uncharacterized protein DUF4174 [Hasllibacter halocynthiae]
MHRRPFIVGLAALAALPLAAQEMASGAGIAAGPDAPLSALERWEADPTTVFDASEVDLGDFQWIARPVVVFANTDRDPAFGRQVDLLAEAVDDLVARDVVLILDTDPDALSDIRRQLRPRGFMLALLGKDGTVRQRKPAPWSVRELNRAIDAMPLRRQELRDQRSFRSEGG